MSPEKGTQLYAPLFSPDGQRLAWLRKDGRNKYLLQITDLD